MGPVLNKRNFVTRYARGEFGNASPTWLTPDAFLEWGCKEFGGGPSYGLFHLRNGVEPGGVTYYKQTWSAAVARWLEQSRKEDWYCSMQIPPNVEESLLIQGEVQQSEGLGGRYGLELYYTTVAKPMRDALKECAHQVHGIMASSLLRMHLCPNSYEWLEELLRRYPQHVVEFSTYRKCWGTLPNFNTVFWEVRLY